MAFFELQYFSAALQKRTAANIILPDPTVPAPYNVFYLLHGLSGDHTEWHRFTGIERFVEGLPLMVVMPEGGRGFYCDAKEGLAWETSIVGDLVSYVDASFRTRACRAGRAIGGMSMGGYGAVKLGLKYAHLFCSANSHSGALEYAHRKPDPNGDMKRYAETRRILGDFEPGGREDCYALAEGTLPGLRPALRIDCGADDFLIESNRSFHAHLKDVGYAHEYAEFPGEHNFKYWDEHLREAVAFHVRNMALTRG